MASCICMFQENQIDSATRLNAEKAIAQFSTEQFQTDIPVHWLEIAKGNGFSAAEPSVVSVVNMESPVALSQSRREELLYALGALWREVTGCGEDEVVLVVRDPAE